MVAVVVFGVGRRLKISTSGNLAIIEIGRKTSVSKLRTVLEPFGDGFIFCNKVHQRFGSHFKEFDHHYAEKKLLFNAFKRAVEHGSFGKIGVVCCEDITPLSCACLLRHATELCFVGCEENEDFLSNCILQYGTCPDFCNFKDIYSCDAVFAPMGVPSFDGVLFGHGGITVSQEGLPIPLYASCVLNRDIDILRLFSLICAEENIDIESIVPKIVRKGIVCDIKECFLQGKEIFCCKF